MREASERVRKRCTGSGEGRRRKGKVGSTGEEEEYLAADSFPAGAGKIAREDGAAGVFPNPGEECIFRYRYVSGRPTRECAGVQVEHATRGQRSEAGCTGPARKRGLGR